MSDIIKEYERRTKDDEQARRLTSLLVGFLAAGAIPSNRVHELWYSDMSEDTFMRTFQRDRRGLRACGVVIESTQTVDDRKLWALDRTQSLADAGALTTDEVVLLDILCAPLTDDPSFAYRNELAIALAKANRSLESVSVRRSGGQDPADARTLDTLTTCLAEHRPVKVTYVDAQGDEKNRVLGLLGTFGLRGNTYFVAAPYDSATKALVGEPHTYRLDRFGKATAVAGKTFDVPRDFSVGDYVKLPFQLGPTLYEAAFDLGGAVGGNAELARAVATQGLLDADGLWRVDVSDTAAACAWAISVGIAPVSPAELVECWTQTLKEAIGDAR